MGPQGEAPDLVGFGEGSWTLSISGSKTGIFLSFSSFFICPVAQQKGSVSSWISLTSIHPRSTDVASEMQPVPVSTPDLPPPPAAFLTSTPPVILSELLNRHSDQITPLKMSQ